MRFTRGNDVVYAFQFTGEMIDQKGRYYFPDWAIDALLQGDLYMDDHKLFLKHSNEIEDEEIIENDYIYKSSKGEFGRVDGTTFADTFRVL